MIRDDVAALRLRLTAPRDDALAGSPRPITSIPAWCAPVDTNACLRVPDNEAEAMSGPQPLPASTGRGEVKNLPANGRLPAGGCVRSEMKKEKAPFPQQIAL